MAQAALAGASGASGSSGIRMVLAGDVMLSRRLSVYREDNYLKLVDLIQGADLAFANLETCVRMPHEGVPNFTQGTPMSTPPALLEELRWMGFGMVSVANNHVTDYGTSGVQATLHHLRAAGLPHAGAGENLARARAPAYVETAAGRVGLVAATSFFRPWNRASNQRPDAIGRPGIHPLGFTTSYMVDEASFDALRTISNHLGMTQERARHRKQFYSAKEVPSDGADTLTLLGSRFAKGRGFKVSTKVNADDAQATLQWLREARRQCDWLVFSFHFHDFGSHGQLSARSEVELETPADFAVQFARAAIDAGADIVAGHGPHLTMGVEIHDGKPIFYGLGNFVFQNDTVDVFPSESYERFGLGHDATPADFLDARTDKDTRGFPAEAEFWEAYVAECSFSDRQLSSVVLHPIDLGHGLPRAQRGRPVLAQGDKAARILARLSRLSAHFGTQLDIHDGHASVRLAGAATTSTASDR